jgi:hypothetical protein
MKKNVLIFVFTAHVFAAFAQDDLMKELEESRNKDTDYSFQTFKGTRLVNGHTIETKPKQTLEFIFAHRFGPLKGGIYEMYGLDQASVRLGLDYGLTDKLSASIARNSLDKTLDGYLKYKVARQSKGGRTFPVSITALAGAAYKMSPKKEDAPEGFENVDRLAYVTELLIARKFNTNLSLQIAPVYIHKNAVDQDMQENDQFALGFGGRMKVTKSVAITTEYYYRLNVQENNPYYNSFGIGVDIETGGHVFQLIITNTQGLTERAFITETTGEFNKDDILFGFNVTRTFQLGHKK